MRDAALRAWERNSTRDADALPDGFTVVVVHVDENDQLWSTEYAIVMHPTLRLIAHEPARTFVGATHA